jgi:hypothetical protein
MEGELGVKKGKIDLKGNWYCSITEGKVGVKKGKVERLNINW